MHTTIKDLSEALQTIRQIRNDSLPKESTLNDPSTSTSLANSIRNGGLFNKEQGIQNSESVDFFKEIAAKEKAGNEKRNTSSSKEMIKTGKETSSHHLPNRPSFLATRNRVQNQLKTVQEQKPLTPLNDSYKNGETDKQEFKEEGHETHCLNTQDPYLSQSTLKEIHNLQTSTKTDKRNLKQDSGSKPQTAFSHSTETVNKTNVSRPKNIALRKKEEQFKKSRYRKGLKNENTTNTKTNTALEIESKAENKLPDSNSLSEIPGNQNELLTKTDSLLKEKEANQDLIQEQIRQNRMKQGIARKDLKKNRSEKKTNSLNGQHETSHTGSFITTRTNRDPYSDVFAQANPLQTGAGESKTGDSISQKPLLKTQKKAVTPKIQTIYKKGKKPGSQKTSGISGKEVISSLETLKTDKQHKARKRSFGTLRMLPGFDLFFDSILPNSKHPSNKSKKKHFLTKTKTTKSFLRLKAGRSLLSMFSGAIPPLLCCALFFSLFVVVTMAGSKEVKGCEEVGEMEEVCWNFFRSKGLNEKQTAGILGNIYEESRFEPDISGGTFYGLFQMGFSRLEAMFEYAGSSHPSAIKQMEYIWLENFTLGSPYSDKNYQALQTNYFGSDPRGGCKDFNDPNLEIEDYSTSFMMNVERCYTPQTGWQKQAERAASAIRIYNSFAGRGDPEKRDKDESEANRDEENSSEKKDSQSDSQSSGTPACSFSSIPIEGIPDFSRKEDWISPRNQYQFGQCTWFAAGVCNQLYAEWNLDYNFAGGAGNGINWVNSLVSRYPDRFERSSYPIAGSVFSGGSLPYGHVGVIMQVDGNQIVYADGNYDGISNTWDVAIQDWAITHTTLQNFEAVYHPVYANPINPPFASSTKKD